LSYHDVSAILLLEDVIHTLFKVGKRLKAVKHPFTYPVGRLVVLRAHRETASVLDRREDRRALLVIITKAKDSILSGL
jgi:hypothetical protein